MGSPIQSFASAGHWAGALLEHQTTRVAKVGLALPQALFDPGRVENVASTESEGVGRARGPLLEGAAILLRRSGCGAKQCCHQCDTATSGFEIISDHSSLIDLGSFEAGLRKPPK